MYIGKRKKNQGMEVHGPNHWKDGVNTEQVRKSRVG